MRKIYDKANHKSEREARISYDPVTYAVTIALPSADTEVSVSEARKLVIFGDDLPDVEAPLFADATREGINVRMPLCGDYQPLAISASEVVKIRAAVDKLEIALMGGDAIAVEATEKARDRFERLTGRAWVTRADMASEDDAAVRADMATWNARGLEIVRLDKLQRKAVSIAKLHTMDRRRWLARVAGMMVEAIDAVMADPVRWKRLPKRTRDHIIDKRARALVQAQSGRILDEARARIVAEHDLDMAD